MGERRRGIYNAALEGERACEGWKSLIEGAWGKGKWRPVGILAALNGIGIDNYS